MQSFFMRPMKTQISLRLRIGHMSEGMFTHVKAHKTTLFWDNNLTKFPIFEGLVITSLDTDINAYLQAI